MEEEVVYEVGKSKREDGIVYYFLNETLGWRLVVVDAAAGSRWYRIETTSGFKGKKYLQWTVADHQCLNG